MPELAVLVAGDDRQGGGIEEPAGIAGCETHPKFSLGDGVDAIDQREEAAGRGIGVAAVDLECERGIVGGERTSVVPEDVIAQRENELQAISSPLPAFR